MNSVSEEVAGRLPRLLYLGDVPVERSYHGSLLLYRLLEDYPPEKLLIVEGNLHLSEPERRLPDVRYKSINVGTERILRTRLHKVYAAALSLSASARTNRVEKSVADFEPEAIITVSHEYSWITAASFAKRHNLPLHLICHDDWADAARVPPWFRRWLQSRFARIYNQAISRLCVSPFMRDAYRNRYGIQGDVLFPFRSMHSPAYDATPPRLGECNQELVVAFAGTIHTPDYFCALRMLAETLEEANGRLLIFGPLTAEEARHNGVPRKNVTLRGLVDPNALAEHLRAEADVLFVPMSFDASDRSNTEISFPSKLADYTATALPILIYGPPYCSAVRWATENPGMAESVSRAERGLLKAALLRLRDPVHRAHLSAGSLQASKKFFSHNKAQQLFQQTLICPEPKQDLSSAS